MEIDPVEILRKKGLKVTPQRLAVLKLLSKGGHYSVNKYLKN
jgi:Ferric uptake regulator family.